MYTRSVRRLAVLYALLLAFGYSLIAPALLALTAESNLPACCRRDGKHRCSMEQNSAPASTGPAFRAVSGCPMFPAGKSAPSAKQTGAALPAVTLSSPVPEYPAVAEHGASLFQPAFERTSPKRGPPSLNS